MTASAYLDLTTALHMDPWATQAACVGLWDLLETPALEREAKRLCATCPVQDDCRKWVLTLPYRQDPGGVRGGLTENERNNIRRREQRKPPRKRRNIPAEKPCAQCGETKPASDYYRNPARRDGLDAKCRPCRRIDKTETERRRRAALRQARQQAAEEAQKKGAAA